MEATIIQSENTSNILFGTIGQYPNENNINIEYSNLFDNFFNLIKNNSYTTIINSPIYFDLNYVSNSVVDLEIIEIDYLLLSESDQQIINNFINLF